MMYHVGDRVAYPMHGAGVIEAIERREILGKTAAYYVLHFTLTGMKVMIPVDSPMDNGLRAVIGLEQLEQLWAYLAQAPDPEDGNWNRRYRNNLERIKTGDLFEVADVVRTLMRRDRDKGLSTGERKMLLSARQILLSEIMLVTGELPEQVDDQLERTVFPGEAAG
ncbi:MAG: CarD family transcriptional regulator [Christensenellales bacterium]|jgi:CarD family transcriptional regulator